MHLQTINFISHLTTSPTLYPHLYDQLPPAIRLAKPLEMDAPMSESEALGTLKVQPAVD